MAKKIWYPWRCKCCDPPPCKCCPGQTPTMVSGKCVCLPELLCPDGRPKKLPRCDCDPPPECPVPQCPDNSAAQPWPICCNQPPPLVNCEGCCPIGDENNPACTPAMFLMSVPDATPNPDPRNRCPDLPTDVTEGCVGNVFTRMENHRSCANGGSYYLICNREKYYSYRTSLSENGCDAYIVEYLTTPSNLIDSCCRWTFCRVPVAVALLADPFCVYPPQCPYFGVKQFNSWCYAYHMYIDMANDSDGWYFKVGITIGGNCQGSGGGECSETGVSGMTTITGRSPSEPRPINCFAARTIPLTHYNNGATPLPMPPSTTPGAYGVCSGGSDAWPACLFPAGQSVTIQGISA